MSIRTSRRALPALGLALLLPVGAFGVANSAFGGEPKPKPAPPASGKAAPAAPAMDSLAAIEGSFDAQEEASKRSIRAKRYEAIAAYVKAHGSASDAERARGALVDLAEELEDWGKVVADADAFLGAHASSERKGEIEVSRAQALANLGRGEDAKKAYQAAVKTLEGNENLGLVWTAWSGFADVLTGLDDFDGAKKAYEDAKEHLKHPQLIHMAEQAALHVDLIGKEPTPFPETAKDLDAKAVSLEQFKGKVVLVDFWATWCAPCKAEIPHVLAAYEKFHDKGFEVIGVVVNDQEAKVREFTQSRKMPWKQVFYSGEENDLAQAYNVSGIPHTVLIGADGRILRIGVRGAALSRLVAKALGSAPAKQ